MTHFYFMFLSITLGIIFTQMIHPLAMGLLLIFQTMLIALITGYMAPTFWFSYILFLVFLGGMLVLFIYVTSLASNEMFTLSARMLIIIPFMVLFFIFMSILNDPLYFNFPLLLDFSFSYPHPSFIGSAPALLIKLYHSSSMILTLLLVLYLFLTLIVVVYITNIQDGPLRPRN